MMARKKYTVLDLFCGCGGISKGFDLADYKIIGGIDFNEDATKTFQHNFKDAKVLCTDISTVNNADIVKLYPKVDVIVGGPPWSSIWAPRGATGAAIWSSPARPRTVPDVKPAIQGSS